MNILSPSKGRKWINLPLILPLVLIIVIGLVTLYSTLILPTGGLGDTSILVKQILFLVIGIILFIAISYIDLSYLKYWQVQLIIYLITIALLIVVLLFGPVIKGVKRWLVIGGVQIQPSEIAKLTVIILTAFIFSLKDKYNKWTLFLLSFFLMLPIFFLIYKEPSGSMAFLTLAIWFIVAFLGLNHPLRNTVLLSIIGCTVGAFLISSVTGNNLWYLLLIPATMIAIFGFYTKNNWKVFVIIASVLALFVGALTTITWHRVLKPYQKDRVVAFINPEETTGDIGFNVNQSKIAIGSGRIFGKGFGNGTQSKRNFLPEFRTDFIFASFAEEFGLVGSVFLISLYAVIIVICFLGAINSSGDVLQSLLCVGIGVKLLLEVFINIGTNTGGIPATGIPLPLMSAGGTITIMTLIQLGIVHNIILKNSQKIQAKNADIIDIYED